MLAIVECLINHRSCLKKYDRNPMLHHLWVLQIYHTCNNIFHCESYNICLYLGYIWLSIFPCSTESKYRNR